MHRRRRRFRLGALRLSFRVRHARARLGELVFVLATSGMHVASSAGVLRERAFELGRQFLLLGVQHGEARSSSRTAFAAVAPPARCRSLTNCFAAARLASCCLLAS